MQKVSDRLKCRCHGIHRDLFQPGAVRPRKGLFMARIAWPRLVGWVRVLMPLLLVAGCAPWHRPLPILPEVTQDGVAARLLVSPDLNVNLAETVVKPGTPGQASLGRPMTDGLNVEPTTFALADAIAFALQNSPQLRSARAAI